MRPQLPAGLRAVLRLKAEGLTHQQIAAHLGLQKSSVDTYVKRLKHYFHDEPEMQIEGMSAHAALVLIGQRYFARLSAEGPALSPAVSHMRLPAAPIPTIEWGSPLGMRLLLLGDELQQQLMWQEALPLFRKAEQLLGASSKQAATAARRIAAMYVELGDYATARMELQRTHHTYGSVMDLETAAELYHLQGWMDYYEGHLAQAVTWFEQCLLIADESGREQIAQNELHFLGCLYADWGHLARTKQGAKGWFHQADEKLTEAYQLHLKYGDSDEQGYDVFRQAQLRRMQRQWFEAAHFRERARHLFSNELLTLSIDLEEAALALQNSEIGPARWKAEEALLGWALVGNAKGMADALQLLARSNYVEGKSEQALECYTAALCIYPFEHHLSNRHIWTAIDEIGCREDSKATRQWTRRLRDAAETRQGYFVYLNSVSADRSADIDRVFSRLRSRGM